MAAKILPVDRNLYRWDYVYLHGNAEEIMAGHYEANDIASAPDIFMSDRPMPPVGSYPVTIFDVPAVVNIAERHGIVGGRVALVTDTEALRHVMNPEEWR